MVQRRARWIILGRDKNQDFWIFKNWVKQESRILKSSRISAVKNQDFSKDFLDFKQESRKVKLQFLISSGIQDLNFGKRQETQARIKINWNDHSLFNFESIHIFTLFVIFEVHEKHKLLFKTLKVKTLGFQEFFGFIFKFKTRSRIWVDKPLIWASFVIFNFAACGIKRGWKTQDQEFRAGLALLCYFREEIQ